LQKLNMISRGILFSALRITWYVFFKSSSEGF